MTSEQLHDALTLLPADLIAEADKKRCPKPKVIVWKRYASMAACFGVILFSVWFIGRLSVSKGSTEYAREAAADTAAPQAAEETLSLRVGSAPREEAADNSQWSLDAAPAAGAPTADSGDMTSGIQYVKTPYNLNTTACYAKRTGITLVSSRAELEAYLEKWKNLYLLDELMETCAHCDETWFEIHDLLLIVLRRVPAEDIPKVTEVQQRDGQWDICIESYPQYAPEGGEPEYTDVHILMEVDKGLIPDASSVTLIYE